MKVVRRVVPSFLVLVMGFGAGTLSGVRTRTVTETRTVTRVGLPADCGKALTLAGDGLGLAQQAMAQGRAAVQAAAVPASSRGEEASRPSGTSTVGLARLPSDALFGEAMSRLLFAQRQYMQARSACETAVARQQPGQAAAPATTGH